VGRLDINTEGLLLLTNDGGLARVLELPATGWLRRYRVRAHGEVKQEQLDRLRRGVTIDGIRYGEIEAKLDRAQGSSGSNVWLTFAIREGKNREVKNVMDHLGLAVNRLIRVSFGPFQLGELPEGAVEEVKTRTLRDQLGERLAASAGADFAAPIMEREGPNVERETPVAARESASSSHSPRHPEVRAHFGEPRRATARADHPPTSGLPEIGISMRKSGKPDLRRPAKTRAPQDDGVRTGARPDRSGAKRTNRRNAERIGQPELARMEKRRGRRPPHGKKR
jgi:23S rRNA pseudouridine2605 synthase